MCFSSGSFTNRMSCCLSSCMERHLLCCHYAYVITPQRIWIRNCILCLIAFDYMSCIYSSIVQSLCRLSLISAFTQLCSVLGDAIGVAVACTINYTPQFPLCLITYPRHSYLVLAWLAAIIVYQPSLAMSSQLSISLVSAQQCLNPTPRLLS